MIVVPSAFTGGWSRTIQATPCSLLTRRVEYSLTPLGESLREPFGQLYDWTVEHSGEIQNCQRAYDARADAQSS
ncbi:winged helix-turn-helix transcriptional regulator [Streptomyces griseoloalbus]|uniref:Winged helix-turn-helix transcriptional regulator n=1 Tax=Streptomyces griseoloalbus TaxID=67303 RepID=A0ABV3E5V4_9ACTN